MLCYLDLLSLSLGLILGLLLWEASQLKKKSPPPVAVVSLLKNEETSPRENSPRLTSSVGSLHCYVGPMFSGKTSSMLSSLVRYADITRSSPPLIINHDRDRDRVVGNGKTRLGVSSHSSQLLGLSERVRSVYTTSLAEVDVSTVSVIGIDEAQFYPDLYSTVIKWLNEGKHVYCASLDGSFLATNFGQIHQLLPLADSFVKKLAVCHICTQELACSGIVATPSSFVPAPFTSKIAGDKELQIDTGGQEKYIPTCRYHFLKLQGISLA